MKTPSEQDREIDGLDCSRCNFASSNIIVDVLCEMMVTLCQKSRSRVEGAPGNGLHKCF